LALPLLVAEQFGIDPTDPAKTPVIVPDLRRCDDGAVQPLERGADRPGLIISNAVIHPAAVLASIDQAGLPEDGEMPRDGGGGKAKEADDLADAEFAMAECHERPDAALIGEGSGDFHEGGVGHGGWSRGIRFVISPDNEMIAGPGSASRPPGARQHRSDVVVRILLEAAIREAG
jgi:hypothetical protein